MYALPYGGTSISYAIQIIIVNSIRLQQKKKMEKIRQIELAECAWNELWFHILSELLSHKKKNQEQRNTD